MQYHRSSAQCTGTNRPETAGVADDVQAESGVLLRAPMLAGEPAAHGASRPHHRSAQGHANLANVTGAPGGACQPTALGAHTARPILAATTVVKKSASMKTRLNTIMLGLVLTGAIAGDAYAIDPNLCFATSDGTDQLVTIGKSGSPTALIGSIGRSSVEAITISLNTSLLYAANQNGSTGEFGSLNQSTGAFSLIGTLGSGAGALGNHHLLRPRRPGHRCANKRRLRNDPSRGVEHGARLADSGQPSDRRARP